DDASLTGATVRFSDSDSDLPIGQRSIVDLEHTFRMDDSDASALGPDVKGGATVKASTNVRADKTESLFNIPARTLWRGAIAPSLPKAKQLTDYRIEGELGHGGMGVVFLARQTSLDREVALKQILIPSGQKMTDAKRRSAENSFLAEAVVTGDLNHPNIVPV